jgi:hypothetical protein
VRVIHAILQFETTERAQKARKESSEKKKNIEKREEKFIFVRAKREKEKKVIHIELESFF